jgi:hypothetical protein
MKSHHTVTVIASFLLVSLFAGSIAALRGVDTVRGKEATLEEVLYMPSGRTLKRMSLGYSGLLADVYWTRAVQYFGNKHLKHSMRYDLLSPLLDITTDLDPHLIVAYQSGAIFLSQRPPDGAGQPDKGVALLQKGLRANPTYWRLYFTLGFVHYLERHDFKAAQEAFETGAEMPDALPWMKVMAARMAERSQDVGTALDLWNAIYHEDIDKTIRETALKHILSLQADAGIDQLERVVQAYRQHTGVLPGRWEDLVRAQLLPGIPQDPTGVAFKLMADGTVEVRDPSQFPFMGQGRR